MKHVNLIESEDFCDNALWQIHCWAEENLEPDLAEYIEFLHDAYEKGEEWNNKKHALY